ncbi:MAG: thiamine pyrophosphate-dependent enzyme, partial [Candidatus Eremiobacterota bacterium]
GHVAGCVKQEMVDQLIRAFRVRGHRIARLDPLGSEPPPFPELQLEHYGLTEADLDTRFSCRALCMEGLQPLRDILSRLHNTYCRSIGVQFMHIDDHDIKFWLQERMESTENRRKIPREEQLRILTRLTDGEIFESFLQKKFVGAKRFSLEGAESLIPLLDLALEDAGEHGIDEIVIGMAHRGRINVLANIMQKSAGQIFREFVDKDPGLHFGRGDVKYHQGYASTWTTSRGKRIRLELCFNPSHLEFVGPVVLGRVRARQDRRNDRYVKVMGLVIHGDAAFAGQGVVPEMLNMSEIPGYRTGGTLHVIVNNQVGFTTPPSQARSSTYPSDVAKMLQIPILHVNGEDPEAVAQAIHLAMDFRERFHKDVVIDMYCYRRHGHNEGDDPTFTQPVLYSHIRQRQSTREGYLESLLKLGEVTREEADDIAVKRLEHLEAELSKSLDPEYDYEIHLAGGVWSHYRGGPDSAVPEVPTWVPRERLHEVLLAMNRVPEAFFPHPKVPKLLFEARQEMAEGKRPLDRGSAEAQ